jgi:hypothetical protein
LFPETLDRAVQDALGEAACSFNERTGLLLLECDNPMDMFAWAKLATSWAKGIAKPGYVLVNLRGFLGEGHGGRTDLRIDSTGAITGGFIVLDSAKAEDPRVLSHELGHSVGLTHIEGYSVMQPLVGSRPGGLTGKDVKRLRRLYG